MKRLILHWSAGPNKPTQTDLRHYHFVVAGDGSVVPGIFKPEANLALRDGSYAAHTLNCNTGSIGVAVAGMAGAVERPFSPGRSPMTPKQIDALAGLCARLCAQYKIPVTRQTVLTHAEVQPTLGIRQRGKWDITWLPGMGSAGDPVVVGDKLRGMIQARMAKPIPPALGPVVGHPDAGWWIGILNAILAPFRRLFGGK